MIEYKCVRLLRYSDWLPKKSVLKLANWIFAHLRKLRARKRETFGISKKPHTLLRIDNQGTFWLNFIKIRQIYIPYYCAWRREIKFLSFLSFTFKAWFLKRKWKLLHDRVIWCQILWQKHQMSRHCSWLALDCDCPQFRWERSERPQYTRNSDTQLVRN